MASSNTRATRSRFSSPQVTPNGPSDPAKGSTASARPENQRSITEWLEPPLNSKASYQDAGLVKHGVVENMAPLGTLPKAGVFKKSVAPPSTSTPEYKTQPTKIVVLKRKSPLPPAPAPPAAKSTPAPEEDETEEEEEEPIPEPRRDHRGYDLDASGRPALTRRSLQSREEMDDDWASGQASYRAYSRRSMSRASGGRMGSMSSSSYHQGPRHFGDGDPKDMADSVAEKAVAEALKLCRYPTAWALRTLYDEMNVDEAFVGMFLRIFRQTATTEDLTQFGQLMAAKKRLGKKDNQGYDYFTSSKNPAPAPKVAPYGHLLTMNISALRQATKTESESEPETLTEAANGAATEGEAETEAEAEAEALAEPEPERQGQGQGQEEERENQQPEKLDEPLAGASLEQVATASPPQHHSERVSKRELPEDEDDHQLLQQHQETGAKTDAHVRKKQRRSKRHSTSASKMPSNSVTGNAKIFTPSRRRTRANSHSSTSSLSSAQSLPSPSKPQEEDADAYAVPPSRTSPAAQEVVDSNAAARPKRAARRGRGGRVSYAPPRKSTRATASSEAAASKASTPVIGQHATSSKQTSPALPDESSIEQPYDLPAIVDTPSLPPSKKGKSGINGVTLHTKIGKIDENDEKFRLRQAARAVTAGSDNNLEQSFARALPPREDATPAPPSRSRASLPAGRATPTAATTSTRATRSSRKRSHDEIEDPTSPTTANFAPSEVAPSTAANSRAGTPALRPAKKARTGLRVKNSPMKKKPGSAAGIARVSGEQNSPIMGANREADENDDYCTSCGGNGQLICCDGCTRAFHFNCVDPPAINGSIDGDTEWYCNPCRVHRAAVLPVYGGPFGPLLEKLETRNSNAFGLPVSLRSLFEGVRTGPDGEYEEIVAPVPKGPKKKKSEEEATTDLFRLRDAEGNPVICHACQRSSETTRMIIPCTSCGLYWHLDCLDPPLAIPPVLRTWKCPCHIEDVLSKVPGALGPAHKWRKIKNAPVIKPAFGRDFINNGYIEVEPEEDRSGWKDPESYGRVVRLPERGIKQDFLSRVRVNRKGKPIPPRTVDLSPIAVPQQLPLDRAALERQQAALSLAQLSGKDTAPIDTLVDTLISEADPTVVSLIARAKPENLTAGENLTRMDQQGLRAMLAHMEETQARIRQLLSQQTSEQASLQPATGATGTTSGQDGRVPSLTLSQTTEAESDAALLSRQTPRESAPGSLNQSSEKDLPSPAATDDAMPVPKADDDQLGSSPADDNTAAEDNIPVTPTDTRMIDADDSVVVKEPQTDKTAVEIEGDGMDLE